jgi:hypothetical protein
MKKIDPAQQLRDKMWNVGEELADIREELRERKTERLQLRVTPTEKQEVETVTDLLGVSVADYLMHLHRRALKDLERKNKRRSSREAERESKSGGDGEAGSVESKARPKGRQSSIRKGKRRDRRGNDEDGDADGVFSRL